MVTSKLFSEFLLHSYFKSHSVFVQINLIFNLWFNYEIGHSHLCLEFALVFSGFLPPTVEKQLETLNHVLERMSMNEVCTLWPGDRPGSILGFSTLYVCLR